MVLRSRGLAAKSALSVGYDVTVPDAKTGIHFVGSCE